MLGNTGGFFLSTQVFLMYFPLKVYFEILFFSKTNQELFLFCFL